MMTRTLCAGMSLIEVLIGLLVFSLGIMSVTRLQVAGKMASYDAVQRQTATLLVNDIIQRMRTNSDALATYTGVTVGGGTRSQPSPDCLTSTTTCTRTQMATRDLWEWEQAVDGAMETASGVKSGGLVSPTGCITSTAGGTAGIYTVALAYRGNVALSNPTSSTCGSSSAHYGTNNEYRRVLVMSVYIN